MIRNGLVEATHHASAVAVDLEGRVVLASGDVGRPFFFRSAAKPFQAKVSQELGADLDPEELAVACASHDGDPVHVALVGRMLREAGLVEDHLRCPPGWPLNPASARRLAAGGATTPRRIWHNCSGKHAAFLRACRAQDWELDGYLRPDHPLQRAVIAEMRDVAGPSVSPLGVDGCGVPTFRVDAVGLAGAFRRLVTDTAYAEVARVMHTYPVLVSGVGNPDSEVASWLNAVAKRGAEGCMGVGLFELGAVAVKIWDGNARAVGPAIRAVLDELGWIPPGVGHRLALTPSIRGGEGSVGSVEVRLV